MAVLTPAGRRGRRGRPGSAPFYSIPGRLAAAARSVAFAEQCVEARERLMGTAIG